jgi:hypothetical protein
MPKPPDESMSAHLRRLLLAWLAEDPTRTEVDFAKASGLSKATINTIKNKGAGGGFRTVQGFAKALGKTPAQLHAEAEGATPLSAYLLRQIPGWEQIRKNVAMTPRGRLYSEAAWRAAGNTPAPQVLILDEFQVQQLVDWWHHVLESAPPTPGALKAS